MRWPFQMFLLPLSFGLLSMSTVQLICTPYLSPLLLRCRREGPRALPKVHEGSVAACHMSADGKLLVTGGYDLRVVLWDLEEMAHKVVLRVSHRQLYIPVHQCQRVQGHTDWINDVCITNDNKWIVSVSSVGYALVEGGACAHDHFSSSLVGLRHSHVARGALR